MNAPVTVVVSDTHHGSSVGLCPPRFETNEGSRIELSKAQRFLWAAFEDFKERLDRIGDFDLVFNGDVIEGMHHRTVEVISPDPGDHLRMAIETWLPVCEKAKKVHVVRGTEAHTGPSSELGFANAIGADVAQAGSERRDRLDIDIHGVRCRFVHHSGGTRREWTKINAVAMEMQNHRLACLNARRPAPRVLALAHLHHYAQSSDGEWLAFRTPAWRFAGRYDYKVIPSAENVCGAVILDWRQSRKGELPAIVPWLWRPKP